MFPVDVSEAAPPKPAVKLLPMLPERVIALPERVRLFSEVVVPIAPPIETLAAPDVIVKLCVAAVWPLRVPVMETGFPRLAIVAVPVIWTLPGKVRL